MLIGYRLREEDLERGFLVIFICRKGVENLQLFCLGCGVFVLKKDIIYV